MFNRLVKNVTRIFIGSLLTFTSLQALADESKSKNDMPIWIDVRTAEEFASGHVDGAYNIPYEDIGKEISSITRDIDADIRVYCRSGRRSGIAKDTLNGMGYENVVNEGGFEDIQKRN